MNHELCVFLSTVAGEAGRCGIGSWQAVASSIINRVEDTKREWKAHKTVLDVISKTGYDAFTHKNFAYRDAFDYFQNSGIAKPNRTMDKLRAIVEPIYTNRSVRPYPTTVLYYSPMALIALNMSDPARHTRKKPNWNFSLLKQVFVPGATQDDMAFFAYK